MDRLIDILVVLSQIFLACLPVFIVLELLDRAMMKLTAKMQEVDLQAYFDARLDKAKAKEQAVWNKRAQTIDEREKND